VEEKSKSAALMGRAISVLLSLALLGDAAINILTPEKLAKEQQQVGFALDASPMIGAIMLVCILLYIVPRTSVIGAILLTGFLGGAICTHFRIGEVGSPSELISLILGVLVWLGLALRNPVILATLLKGTAVERQDHPR
jgi:hypothetical protein